MIFTVDRERHCKSEEKRPQRQKGQQIIYIGKVQRIAPEKKGKDNTTRRRP